MMTSFGAEKIIYSRYLNDTSVIDLYAPPFDASSQLLVVASTPTSQPLRCSLFLMMKHYIFKRILKLNHMRRVVCQLLMLLSFFTCFLGWGCFWRRLGVASDSFSNSAQLALNNARSTTKMGPPLQKRGRPARAPVGPRFCSRLRIKRTDSYEKGARHMSSPDSVKMHLIPIT